MKRCFLSEAHTNSLLRRIRSRMNRRTIHILLGIVALLMMADFIFRGLVPALHSGKNDFTEIYTGAWLWRHGQNFYDPDLATQTSTLLTGAKNHIALVYPPTTLMLTAPLTFLSWRWASLIWFSSGLVAIAITCILLIRLSGFQFFEQRALLLATFVLAFDPLHQAFIWVISRSSSCRYVFWSLFSRRKSRFSGRGHSCHRGRTKTATWILVFDVLS